MIHIAGSTEVVNDIYHYPYAKKFLSHNAIDVILYNNVSCYTNTMINNIIYMQ